MPGNLLTMIPPRLEPLFAAGAPARELAQRFAAAGKSLYLVGGSVRDALLGRDIEDLDYATDALPPEIRSIVAEWADDLYLLGEEYGTVGAVHRGAVHEITTFRSDLYREESRKPRVEFADDLETDLSRRDFTINALAIKVPADDAVTPEMLDPFEGLADLAARVLRTPLEPEVSFGDDPLRMLRLFRFVSTLGFAPDRAAIDSVRAMRGRLSIVSAERIRGEFDKLLVGGHVGPALWGLVDTGLAAEFLPELPELAVAQDPVHRHKDVLAHTIAVVEKTSPLLDLRLAALFHDTGKPETRLVDGSGVSFHHHEVVGARMARERMRALRYPKQRIADVSQLVFLHMRPHTYKMGWTDSAVRRYVRDAGALLPLLNELVRCDVTTRNAKRARAIGRRIDELEERIDELRTREELEAMRPPIDGHQVMEHLGIGPGPLVGEVMGMLYERRIEEGPYSEEEAFHLVDDWWSQRGAGGGAG